MKKQSQLLKQKLQSECFIGKQKNPGNPDISWLSIEDENIAKCIFRFVIRMKEKVKQQEMELNASNPQVFLEAQSATKQEVLC